MREDLGIGKAAGGTIARGVRPPEVERFVKQHPSSFFNKIFVNGKIILWESKMREYVRRYPAKKNGKEQEIEERYNCLLYTSDAADEN